ncbi:MAG: WYL domain-containing protein [Caldilineaceae bacterium]
MADHLPFQRSLALLRRLQSSAADRETLAEFVTIACDPDAYPDLMTKAQQKRLENDLQRLRDLGVATDYYEGEYHLQSYGDFSPVGLPEESLETLAFLGETFSPGAPHSEAVQQLLRIITDWLPTNQRDSIPMRRQRLRMDLRRRDDDQIDPRVQVAIDRATSQRRLLRFAYLSPGQADGIPRIHTVQPWETFYDPVRHHLYLDGYRVLVSGPFGEWNKATWQRYRLGRIQLEGIEVLPDKFPAIPPKRPRYALEYWLAPEIARLGEITRHFDAMVVGQTDEQGWVQVTATTDDLFRAVRLLLGYGPNCKVTGGSEARREMVALVEAMAKVYGEEGGKSARNHTK